MPRESVYDSSSQFTVEIGWAKELEDVQVGLAMNSDRSIANWLAAGVDETKAGDLPQFNSLWISLDRAQVNRMIKLLRKARDEAYGRDE